MAYPTPSFAALTGTEPLSLFDAMFAQVAAMVAIPCTASGSANAIVITPTGTAPSLAAYGTGNFFNFKAVGNSSSAVTIQFMALAALPLYFADGTTQVTTQIVSGRNYIVGFDAALNSGNGGYYLPMPQMPGTPGQVLTMAASGPSYAAPAATAMTLLGTYTANNSAALNDTNITGTYSEYVWEVNGIIPVTNATELFFRYHGGGVYISSNDYNYNIIAANNLGINAQSANSAAGIALTSANMFNGAGGIGVNGTIKMSNVSNGANRRMVNSTMAYTNQSTGFQETCICSGGFFLTTAIDGWQVLANSGNLSVGVIKMYGIS